MNQLTTLGRHRIFWYKVIKAAGISLIPTTMNWVTESATDRHITA